MPLTHDEIKALRDKAQLFGLYVAPHEVQSVNCRELAELCTRLLNAEARVADLKSLIKNSDPYLISALTSENNDLQARVKVLEDAGTAILDFHNGPLEAKRPDVFQRLMVRLAAALQEQSDGQ
jgi:hypothetical protein